MAEARTEDFANRDLQLAEWCKALAHPARISILKILASREDCVCGDLVTNLPLAQSTVSQHIKALKKAGLIQGQVVGPKSKYCVNRRVFEKFVAVFGEFGNRICEKVKQQNC